MPLLRLRVLLGMMVAAETVPGDFAMRGGAALGDRSLSVDAVMLEMANVEADMAAVAARYGALRLPVAMLYGRDDQVAAPSTASERARAIIAGALLEMIGRMHMLPATPPQATAAFVRASVARNARATS